MRGTFIFFGFLILGILLGALSWRENFVVGGFIGIAAGLLSDNFYTHFLIEKYGVRDKLKDVFYLNAIIVDKVKEGWTILN